MSKTIRYIEGQDMREVRRQAQQQRQARRFPVRATIYNTNGEGWDRVEARA